MKCRICGNSTEGNRKTCSEYCKRKVSSITASKTNKVYASDRMIQKNPMRNEPSKQKMISTLKEIGHKPSIQGGNGRGMTATQEYILNRLTAHGYVNELIVPLKIGRVGGYPTHYKIDVGNASKKVAIEIDGRSHTSLERQRQDRKKEEFLQDRGWTVIRVPNEAINSSELNEVLRLCCN